MENTSEKVELVLRNRTKLDLVFSYNGEDFEIRAHGIDRLTVEPGHTVSVRDPKHTRVTRKKIEVESEWWQYPISEKTVLDCELIAYQLKFRLGRDVI